MTRLCCKSSAKGGLVQGRCHLSALPWSLCRQPGLNRFSEVLTSQSGCPGRTKGIPAAVPGFLSSGVFLSVIQPLSGLVPIVLCVAVGIPANVPFLTREHF